jgi:hypothetical protein
VSGIGDLVNASTALEDEQLPALMLGTVLDTDPLRVVVPTIDGGKHALNARGPGGLIEGDQVHVMLDELGNAVVVRPGTPGDYSPPIPQSHVTGLEAALAGKAAASHTHPQSAITDLTADLGGKITDPGSGSNGDVLTKNGSGALWLPPSAVPPGGSVGQVLSKASGADGDVEWSTVSGGSPTVVALTDASTITIDASLGDVFTVTLGGDRTIAAPTNSTDGKKITLKFESASMSSTTDWFDLLGVTPKDKWAGVLVVEMIYHAAFSKWISTNVRVATSAGSTLADAILTDNPVLYYPLNEPSGVVANDWSGNGRHGTIAGGSLGVPGGTSDGWTAFQSASAGQYVSYTPGGVLLGNQFTFEGMFYASPAGQRHFWGQPGGGGGNDFLMTQNLQTNTGDGRTELLRQAIAWIGYDASPMTFASSGWRHLVVTSDNVNVRYYVDGTLKRTFAYAFTSNGWSATARAFCMWISGSPVLAQHIAAYSGPLSAGQIADHHAAI